MTGWDLHGSRSQGIGKAGSTGPSEIIPLLSSEQAHTSQTHYTGVREPVPGQSKAKISL